MLHVIYVKYIGLEHQCKSWVIWLEQNVNFDDLIGTEKFMSDLIKNKKVYKWSDWNNIKT